MHRMRLRNGSRIRVDCSTTVLDFTEFLRLDMHP